MQMHRRQRIEFGALIGFVLTIPLAAMFYAVHRHAGFPFVPFTIFDWETRLLPGAVLRAGIDSMVHGIRWLNVGSTSVTAKLAEQTIAVVEFVVAGIFVSTVFFVIARFFTRRLTDIAGVLTGGVLGVSAVLISRSVEITSAVNPVGRALWILLMFLACWEPGFWVVRGWDSEARMKATSAIDTIATNMTIGQPNPQMRVPIGGFAHAGVRDAYRDRTGSARTRACCRRRLKLRFDAGHRSEAGIFQPTDRGGPDSN